MLNVISQNTPLYETKMLYRASKRVFDVTVAGLLLLALSPLLLLIALMIKLDSRGPVFYASKRVGEGYRVFNFYKFRSMRVDADHLLEKMKQMNQYGARQNVAPIPPSHFSWKKNYGDVLVTDEGFISSGQWAALENDEQRKAFVKFQNDPRITRIGRFIRNTSLDELPQLVNVLKGDMSLVGNRPLPPYEASKLTSDEAVGRFLAPSGITGLWQVTERGTGKGDPESRKRLDVHYALTANFLLDMWILLRTPMAAIQQENV